MYSKTSRQNQIIELLNKKETASPKELADLLNVSNATIRRDIKELTFLNKIITHYGYVSISNKNICTNETTALSSEASNYVATSQKHLKEKRQIAKYASSLVESTDAIAIDNGNTCCHMLDYMDKDLLCMIYTYSKNVIDHFDSLSSTNLKLFTLGGYYHSDLKMFEHASIVDTIKTLHLNKFFLGATAVDIEHGLSCAQPYEVSVRQAFIKSSEKVILLAESAKIGKSWFDHYADISDIDILVTDSGISEDYAALLIDHGIDLRIV